MRRKVVRTLGELARDDSWDVLLAARDIVDSVRATLSQTKSRQEASLDESIDYLSPAALKRVEAANKREISARERSGMMEALAAADSLLRDVLVRIEGINESVVNEDVSDTIERIARSASSEGCLRALEALAQARDSLARNVTPQLVIETMLLSVKEALACPPSYR